MFRLLALSENLQLDFFAGCCVTFRQKQWASTWARADKREKLFLFFLFFLTHKIQHSPLSSLVSLCVFFLFLSSIQTGLCSVISEAAPRPRSIGRPNELWFRAWVTQSKPRRGETHRGLRSVHTQDFLNMPTWARPPLHLLFAPRSLPGLVWRVVT